MREGSTVARRALRAGSRRADAPGVHMSLGFTGLAFTSLAFTSLAFT